MMMSQRIGRVVAVGVVACGLGGGAAWADPLPDAVYRVDVRTGGFTPNGYTSNWGGVPMNIHGDWQGDIPNELSFSVTGRAEAFGGLRPMATASANAQGSGPQPWSFSITGSASIDYYVRLKPIGVPPGTFDSIPAYIFIRGHTTGSATSQVVINWLQHYGVTTVNGTDQYDQAVPVRFDPVNSPFAFIQLIAGATGYAFTPGRPPSSEAVADPLLVFDQATFDDEMGPATFNLADYFEFEYSLGIIDMPPVPCYPDVNYDGNVDQDDVAYLIDVIGGGDNSNAIDPDFNHDGNADQDDISALINVVAGGECP